MCGCLPFPTGILSSPFSALIPPHLPHVYNLLTLFRSLFLMPGTPPTRISSSCCSGSNILPMLRWPSMGCLPLPTLRLWHLTLGCFHASTSSSSNWASIHPHQVTPYMDAFLSYPFSKQMPSLSSYPVQVWTLLTRTANPPSYQVYYASQIPCWDSDNLHQHALIGRILFTSWNSINLHGDPPYPHQALTFHSSEKRWLSPPTYTIQCRHLPLLCSTWWFWYWLVQKEKRKRIRKNW